MAFATTRVCIKCDKTINTIQNNFDYSEYICVNCKQVENDNIKQLHFKKLNKLTIEERLRILEEEQYSNNLYKNNIKYDPHTIYGSI